ncbi:MAG: glycosyltransferase family 2 protein [Candidatus Gastranaerophilales bacterium]|nr:glycosyltransferase family 2 protein [Candidatus Gastranaerophilales bacterium]
MQNFSSISAVIPICNELQNIEPLTLKLLSLFKGMGKTFEIVFIDDGSDDGSTELLEKLSSENPDIKLIKFRKNYGKTSAIMAGFQYASGDIVVTLDGDLQNDPCDIPMLVENLKQGYDVISGWRKNRKDNFFLTNLPSRIANNIISKFTGIKLKDNGCFLKVFRKEIVKELDLYGEMHRFIVPLAYINGAKILEVPVQHHSRKHGRSKYNIFKTFQVVLDLLTVLFFKNFITKPLHIFGKISMYCFLCAFLLGTIAVFKKYFLHSPFILEHIVVVTIFTLAGIQLISTGILAEILVRIYHISGNKEIYKIKSTKNLSKMTQKANEKTLV